jgi:hypothetical protein
MPKPGAFLSMKMPCPVADDAKEIRNDDATLVVIDSVLH